MVELSTSILAVNDEKTAIKTFYDLEFAGTNYFHIDVMDGEFVEANTVERMLSFATEIKHISNTPLDVHFMVKDVKKHIEDYIPLEPNRISIHMEAMKDKEEAMELIQFIKENHIRAGIAINPDTKIEEIYDILPYLHHVLVMSVVPGKGGQKLIPETLEKVKQLKTYAQENGLDFDVEIDGGVNLKTIKQVKESGVDIIVAGSYIIHAEDIEEAVKTIKEA